MARLVHTGVNGRGLGPLCCGLIGGRPCSQDVLWEAVDIVFAGTILDMFKSCRFLEFVFHHKLIKFHHLKICILEKSSQEPLIAEPIFIKPGTRKRETLGFMRLHGTAQCLSAPLAPKAQEE